MTVPRKPDFITFEGGEGAGKTTQIKLLAEYLGQQGHDVVTTREPGGTSGAEDIRELLVNGAVDKWADLTECLLMNAARVDHLEKVIKPALNDGKTVLCDRFLDSTRAYQGGAGTVAMKDIIAIETAVIGSCLPDLTFIFDLPVEVGLARAAARGGADRFERKGTAYQEKVRTSFLEIATAEPDRCVILEATLPITVLADKINEVVCARLALGK